eukprot:scaffold125725_cov18-Tisochrysis_lutea.AAC.1
MAGVAANTLLLHKFSTCRWAENFGEALHNANPDGHGVKNKYAGREKGILLSQFWKQCFGIARGACYEAKIDAFSGCTAASYARAPGHSSQTQIAMIALFLALTMLPFAMSPEELQQCSMRGKSKIPKVEIGVQPANLLPPGWPFPASTQVIVCCSTSGASPMTAAERLAPYQDLASKLAGVPWPRADLPRCKAKEDGSRNKDSSVEVEAKASSKRQGRYFIARAMASSKRRRELF